MAVKFTNHAKQRIESRNIEESWIEKIVSNPILTDTDSKNENLIHYYGRVDETGDRILRVVGKTLNGDILIITAFFDRGMRGKL